MKETCCRNRIGKRTLAREGWRWKATLIISLVMLFVLATVCIPGVEARAEIWGNDNPEGQEYFLEEGYAMFNNRGVLVNQGTLLRNYGYVTNDKNARVKFNEDTGVVLNAGTVEYNYGIVYNAGTVINNEGQVFYPVSVSVVHGSVTYGAGIVQHNIQDKVAYWADPDQEAIIYLTPDEGYFTNGIQGISWITGTEENGVWTIRLAAGRPKQSVSLSLGQLTPIMQADNPAGSTAGLAAGRTMQTNVGTLQNDGTLSLNRGYVLNRKGGVVKTNQGHVFNYGGTIEFNQGTEYYLVQVAANHALIRYGSGFVSFAGADFWLAAGGTGSVEIEPEAGYTLPVGNVPEWMNVSESNGVFTVTILQNHQPGSYCINLNVVPSNQVGDNPAGKTVTLESGYTMNNNRGTLENYGTLTTNYGTVWNREGGVVLDNQGTVYNYGGTIAENNGTEYFSVNVFGTEHTDVEYSRGFTSDAGRQWMVPGSEAVIRITPQDGWCLDGCEAPDWIQVQEGNEYLMTIPQDRPAENIQIKVKASTVRSDNPAGTATKLYQSQYMENNNGTLEIEEYATLNQNGSGGRIEVQKGLVRNNQGTISRNYGTGTVDRNEGSLEHNWGTVTTNDNYVGINYPDAVVETNNQSLRINQGTVWDNKNRIDTNEEGGTIVTNNGTISKPNAGTIWSNNSPIGTNAETGLIYDNRSTISNNAGTVMRNSGTVNVNIGTVNNYEGGVVADNQGTVNNYGGSITANSGTVQEYYTVNMSFSHTAVYGDSFTEIEGHYWLRQDQAGTLTVTPDDPSFEIGVDTDRTDVTATSNHDGTWTISIANPTGNVLLREAVQYQITSVSEHGTLAADQQFAVPGRMVTLTMTPESSAHLGSLKVMCGDREIETIQAGDNAYTFIMPEGDVTATALFASNCLVSFVNWDGTMLQYSYLDSGKTPEYTGETPVRESNAMYEFFFAGWEPAISSVAFDQTSVVYTATYDYEPRIHPVAFVDESGNVYQSGGCAYGSTPEYTGETPVKAADQNYVYTFERWEPEITPVSGPSIYTAVFEATPILHLGENPMNVIKWQAKNCPFTPAESGDYRIWSTGDEVHPDLLIKDDTGRRFTYDDEELQWWNINVDGYFNFEYLVHLEGGKNYTLSLEPYFASGSVSLWVKKVNMHTIHYIQADHAATFNNDRAWQGRWIMPGSGYLPDEGYSMVEMIVRDAQGRMLEQNPEEEFTYLMPDSDVYVTATFAPAIRITLEQGDHVLFSAGAAIRIEPEEGHLLIYAGQGAKAEFTVETDEGYALDTLSVTTEDGSPIEYDTYQPNPGKLRFWFTMPSEPLTMRINASQGCLVTFVTREGTGRMAPVAAATDKPYILPECGFAEELFREFAGWQVGDNAGELKQPGEAITLTGDTVLTARWQNVRFNNNKPFFLPGNLKRISEEAFAGSPVRFVKIPDTCTSIGAYAFRNCRNLYLIQIPEGCAIGENAFDGCKKVYIFGFSGSPAEAYCDTHENCIFVQLSQN